MIKNVKLLKDIEKYLPIEFHNYGDISYIEYGGSQLRYDKNVNAFEIYNFYSFDNTDGKTAYLQYKSVDLEDIVDLDKQKLTDKAKDVCSFIGIEVNEIEGVNLTAEQLASYIINIAIGFIDYYGSDEVAEEYVLESEEYSDEWEKEIKQVYKQIKQDFKNYGFDLRK